MGVYGSGRKASTAARWLCATPGLVSRDRREPGNGRLPEEPRDDERARELAEMEDHYQKNVAPLLIMDNEDEDLPIR